MTEKTRALLLDLKARQDADETMMCPRCGLRELKHPVHTNALSRIEDLYVCDTCGTTEAMLAMMQQQTPLHTWYAFQPKRPESGFPTQTTKQVMTAILQEQIDELKQIYNLCREEPDHAMEYRAEAFESCPGLTELWPEPFSAKYTAADGAVVVSFMTADDGTLRMSAGVADK